LYPEAQGKRSAALGTDAPAKPTPKGLYKRNPTPRILAEPRDATLG